MAETKRKPAYAIAQYQITDVPRFLDEYAVSLEKVNLRYGAKFLVRNFEPEVAAGDCDFNFLAVIRFPSMAALQGWLDDEQFKKLLELRRTLTDPSRSRLIVTPGSE